MEQLASVAAPVATTIAALIVASNLGARITGYGFVIFTVGSIAWAFLGYATGQGNLLWQNVVLSALNLFGIWRWLGWQARIEEGAEAASKESRREPGEDLFPVSLLAKAEVETADGRLAGHSIDAMAGCSKGHLHYLVVAQGGIGGVGESLRRVPWAGCHVDGERVKTRLKLSELDSLEVLEPDRWPAR